MKTVRDIMSPVVFYLEEDTYLPEAAKALRQNGISGAPVTNSKGEYVGVLSQSDVNKSLSTILESGSVLDDFLEGGFPTDVTSLQVKDIMTGHVLKISANSTLEELGKALLIADVHRLLVTDEGEVVGLVSTTDLIHGFLSPAKDNEKKSRRLSHKPYIYETELVHEGDFVRLNASNESEFKLEPPKEFGGKSRYSSPEDIFLGSISSFLCLTLMELAKNKDIEVLEYRCRAMGRLEGDGVSLRFTRIDLYPRIKVRGCEKMTEEVLTQAKLRCLVGRSSDVIVVLHPKIESQEFQEI